MAHVHLPISVDWSAHERQVLRCKPGMLAVMRGLARAVGCRQHIEGWDDDSGYRVEFVVFRPGNNHLGKDTLGISLSICDSGDADDGLYGVHGNFMLDIIEEGGRIVGGCVPNNYTDECWVNYDDDLEWTGRLESLARGMSYCKDTIRTWKLERRAIAS